MSVWGFVPLTPCWEGSKVDLEPTTTECVENIFEKMVPEIEFVSTGMMKFNVLSRFFGRQTLGGSHPNCESATLLVSNGDRYLPISSYLTIQLSDLLARLRKLDSHLVLKSAALPATGWQRRVFDARTLLRMMGVLRHALDLKKIFGNPTWLEHGKGCGGSDTGKENRSILKDRTPFKHMLTLITIPYEDKGGLEDARLRDCPAVFAYEDVDTGRIRTTAFLLVANREGQSVPKNPGALRFKD